MKSDSSKTLDVTNPSNGDVIDSAGFFTLSLPGQAERLSGFIEGSAMLPVRLNLPTRLRDVGIPKDGLPMLAENAMEQSQQSAHDVAVGCRRDLRSRLVKGAECLDRATRVDTARPER